MLISCGPEEAAPEDIIVGNANDADDINGPCLRSIVTVDTRKDQLHATYFSCFATLKILNYQQQEQQSWQSCGVRLFGVYMRAEKRIDEGTEGEGNDFGDITA